MVDLGNATLTPGWWTAICTVFGLDLTIGVDLAGATSLDEVLTLLRGEAANDGGWLRGWGLNPNAFGTVPLHRSVLDTVTGGPARAYSLVRWSFGIGKQPRLELAGVHGRFEFDQASEVVCDADGVPTGLLLEAAAMELVQRHIPQESFAQRKTRLAELLGGTSPARA